MPIYKSPEMASTSRYSVLNVNTPIAHRSNYAGKKEATSSLEEASTFKKQHFNINDDIIAMDAEPSQIPPPQTESVILDPPQ